MLTDKARSLLLWHLAEITALYESLPSDHVAVPGLEARIVELMVWVG